MEKIEILLEKLDNRITSALAKRLESYEDLNDELNTLGQEYENDPSDENRVKYNEIIENFEEMESVLIKDLEALLEKRKAEELAKEQKANEPATPPASTEAPAPAKNKTLLNLVKSLFICSFTFSSHLSHLLLFLHSSHSLQFWQSNSFVCIIYFISLIFYSLQ
jgi:hypothetical protein